MQKRPVQPGRFFVWLWPIPVIASEAKQSMPQLAERWIASLRSQ
jgi:hypothetical protein